MKQFVLRHKDAMELRPFPHIMEIGTIKNSAIHLDGFPCASTGGFRIFYVQEGKFEWTIDHQTFILYPGDAALILPRREFGNKNKVLEIGSFSWIHIEIRINRNKELSIGSWSSLSPGDHCEVCKILQMDHLPVLQKFPESGAILKGIQTELFNKEIGYRTRINHLLDELLIQSSRKIARMSNSGRDFPITFMDLERQLRANLAHQWTVEEMAALAGLRTTLFNEKVKSYSGFSPLSYLINIRISEAIKLLKRPDISLTDIALETGFYSSQHFSTTFRKLTGYTPSQFRKNHLRIK
ncbi:MAG: AraC family transcriptional regulator [Bacteroidota bacterium]|nr:AraC family transcriptional regulator [Bacteroidota bacterium]MDP4218267.1 AraC family transcriptional regulator [Bacteroidota bacterium]MDP4245225.1 AraC family transcriptional regulator [Bacteroidota bacterium]MDP4256103.1 AraC family transcriptional regulator [Bacteroidota bacterium]MDP4257229.1 AraC family transcriptional regulator [Bacteroidota bacterium]